jgi:hypothetical protein
MVITRKIISIEKLIDTAKSQKVQRPVALLKSRDKPRRQLPQNLQQPDSKNEQRFRAAH